MHCKGFEELIVDQVSEPEDDLFEQTHLVPENALSSLLRREAPGFESPQLH
jgi:hypothetical protein